MSETQKPAAYVMHSTPPKDSEAWKGFRITNPIPAKFVWRANTYEFDKLTKEQIEAMAKDTRMTSIEAIKDAPATTAVK